MTAVSTKGSSQHLPYVFRPANTTSDCHNFHPLSGLGWLDKGQPPITWDAQPASPSVVAIDSPPPTAWPTSAPGWCPRPLPCSSQSLRPHIAEYIRYTPAIPMRNHKGICQSITALTTSTIHPPPAIDPSPGPAAPLPSRSGRRCSPPGCPGSPPPRFHRPSPSC